MHIGEHGSARGHLGEESVSEWVVLDLHDVPIGLCHIPHGW
jgi:ribosomal silencing factor RsfS